MVAGVGKVGLLRVGLAVAAVAWVLVVVGLMAGLAGVGLGFC